MGAHLLLPQPAHGEVPLRHVREVAHRIERAQAVMTGNRVAPHVRGIFRPPGQHFLAVLLFPGVPIRRVAPQRERDLLPHKRRVEAVPRLGRIVHGGRRTPERQRPRDPARGMGAIHLKDHFRRLQPQDRHERPVHLRAAGGRTVGGRLAQGDVHPKERPHGVVAKPPHRLRDLPGPVVGAGQLQDRLLRIERAGHEPHGADLRPVRQLDPRRAAVLDQDPGNRLPGPDHAAMLLDRARQAAGQRRAAPDAELRFHR